MQQENAKSKPIGRNKTQQNRNFIIKLPKTKTKRKIIKAARKIKEARKKKEQYLQNK